MGSKKIILIITLMIIGSILISACSDTASPPSLERNHIIDKTGTVSQDNLNQFENLAVQLETAGFQVGIAIIDECGGCDTGEFTTKFGNINNLGRNDRGIAIVVFLEEEGAKGEKPAIFVAIGEGLDADLTDGEVGRLLDNTYVPKRSEGHWEEGLIQFLESTLKVLTGKATVDELAPEETIPLWLIILIIIVAIIFLMIVMGSEGGSGGGFLSTGSSSGGGFSGFGGSFGGGGAGR